MGSATIPHLLETAQTPSDVSVSPKRLKKKGRSRVQIECIGSPDATDLSRACGTRTSPKSAVSTEGADEMKKPTPKDVRSPEARPSAGIPDADRASTSQAFDAPELPLDGFSSKKAGASPADVGLPRVEGAVHSYSLQHGSGFLTIDGFQENVFVHQSQIEMSGFRCLHVGERCRFFVYRTPKGLRACNVEPLEAGGFRGAPMEKPVKCFNCGRKGHLARDCRFAKDACHYCHEPGHVGAQCPKKAERKARKEEKPPEKKEKPPTEAPKRGRRSQAKRVDVPVPKGEIPSLRDVYQQMQKAKKKEEAPDRPPRRARSC
uniref:CCHC-type domain-containing protein n=1 Tax=Steinernema glaseri TaxID=37863 RepID=A0A1I8AH03_9BILA